MITFSHYGRIGDIILSLWYVKEYCQKVNQKCIYHIQTNVKVPAITQTEKTYIDPRFHLIRQSAEFLKPLLQKCQFIDHVQIGDTRPQGAINLNQFRTEGINVYGGDLRDFYYNFGDFVLPRAFYEPIIDVQPDFKYKDKILFTLTERYVNCINYVKMKPFKDHIVFMGTEKEFNTFNKNQFVLDNRIVVGNMLEAAQYMKGAKGYVSNQTSFFALAEALKIPRVLFPPDHMMINYKVIPGPKNLLPIGGWCQTISRADRIPVVLKQLISR